MKEKIKIELIGADEIINKLEQIKKLLDEINSKKSGLLLDSKEIANAIKKETDNCSSAELRQSIINVIYKKIKNNEVLAPEEIKLIEILFK